MLILKRPSKSRRSDDDYDVFDGGRYIGRILWTYAASRDTMVLDDHGPGAAVPA